MADENIVFNGNALADECVARYLAIVPNTRVLLNFNERSNFRAITNRAAIKIDLVGMKYLHPLAELNR